MTTDSTDRDLSDVLGALREERRLPRRSLLKLAGAAGFASLASPLLAACAPSSQGPSASTGGSGAVPSGPFQFGVIGPLTGLLASSWGVFNQPLQIAVDELNAKGGVLGRQIQIVKYDDQSSPAQDPVISQKLIADGIQFASGPVGTSAALPSLEQTQKAGVIQGHWGADPRISDPKQYPGSYLVNMTSDQSARLSLLHLLDKAGAKRFAIALANTGDGRAYTDTATFVLNQRGITPTTVEVFEQGSTGLAALVQKVKGTNPDAVLIYGASTGDYTNIFKAITALSWSPLIASNSSTLFGLKLINKDVTPDFLSKIFITAYRNLTWTSSRPLSERVTTVLGKLAKTPDFSPAAVNPSFQGPFYDWMYVLAYAIDQAKSFDTAKVKDSLNNVKNYDGLLGKINFSATSHLAFADDQLTVASPNDLTSSSAQGFLPTSVAG